MLFDSLSTEESETAIKIEETLNFFLINIYFQIPDIDLPLPIKIVSTPKQTNGYDCGVFCLLFAEKFIQTGLDGDDFGKPKLTFDTQLIREKRMFIANLIQLLNKDKNLKQLSF